MTTAFAKIKERKSRGSIPLAATSLRSGCCYKGW
jgi:hypothetical protein